MKTIKAVFGAFMIVAVLGTLSGCEKLGWHGKEGKDGHGHSHE